MSHLGEIASHAAIPAAEALRFALAHLVVTNVVAVAGGAHIGTGAAGKAGRCQLLPNLAIEHLELVSRQLVIKLEAMQGQNAQNLLRHVSLLFHSASVASFFQQSAQLGGKLLTLGGYSLPEQIAFHKPSLHIGLRLRSINAKGVAEAGFLRRTAAQTDKHSILTTSRIIRVHRLLQKYSI